MTFEFEIGLSPEFEVSLKNKKAIESFQIEADTKMIDSQIENIQNQYGKLVSKNSISDGFEINGSFINKELNVDNTTTFQLKNINISCNRRIITFSSNFINFINKYNSSLSFFLVIIRGL